MLKVRWIDYNLFTNMRRLLLHILSVISFLIALTLVSATPSVLAGGLWQIPTGSIPTVTGTPVGAIALILNNEQGFANVRSGPGTRGYDVIGILLPGTEVPALGRTPGGLWIQVVYPGAPNGVGWVFADLVQVRGSLPLIEVPPTATPRTTPTLDPTLAAQFQVDIQPTRLPTYTAPAPLAIPTYAASSNSLNPTGVPMGFLIIGTGALGVLGLLLSFLRNR